jgi:hypothetical protein
LVTTWQQKKPMKPNFGERMDAEKFRKAATGVIDDSETMTGSQSSSWRSQIVSPES